MSSAQVASGIVRFGVFEVNLKTGELRKQGVRIKLQGQPFQVLSVLLEKPGELFTREELQTRLWPKDTFVDFDHSLNKAVNKIRDALSDSADTPRYIETMARRGYRFIAPVQWNSAEPAEAPGNQPVQEPQPKDNIQEVVSPTRPWWWKRAWIPIALLLVSLFFIAYFLRPLMPAPRIVRITQLTNGKTQRIRMLQWGAGKLFYVELRNFRYHLMQLHETGGKPEEITPLQLGNDEFFLWDVSSDGNRLLFSPSPRAVMIADSPVFEYDSANNYLHKIEALQGRWFRWSPDGGKIAFLKGSDLFVANGDGNHQERIHGFNKMPLSCNWSPEGDKLRVCCAPEGADYSVIWEMNRDGTGFHQVLPQWNARQERANWIFNGTYSFFFSDLNLKRGGMEFWSLNEKGDLFHKRRTEPAQLSSGPLLFSWPTASRTSPRLFAIGSSQLGEMMRCELKTGRRVPFLDGISADCLEFSRDGEWVAYLTYPEMELWRARSDGSQKLKLTTRPGVSYAPRYSPDGSRILFSYLSPETGARWKIALIPRDGGEPKILIPEAGFDPNWSPDGNRIVYAPLLGEVRGDKAKVFILDLPSGKISAVPGSQDLWSPRWSPDGKYLTAYTPDAGTIKLFEFSSDRWTDLSKFVISHLLWSPDGKYIQGNRPEGEGWGIYRLRIPDGKLEKVYDLTGINCVGNMWPWAGKTPDGDPLILENRGFNEIYALDLEY